jgi:hypothetical protein
MLTKRPKAMNQSADNNCEDEDPNRQDQTPASIQVATKDAEHSTSYSRH